MDFPVVLETYSFVEGGDAIEQEVKLRLSQKYGTVLHDVFAGNNIPVHADMGLVRICVANSLQHMQDITLHSVEFVSDGVIAVSLTYRGESITRAIDISDILDAESR